MKVLADGAFLACAHRTTSRVKNAPSQHWVTINGISILVEPDPVPWAITGCPNIVPGQKPCTSTIKNVTGYSTFVTVDGHPICLDTIKGLTDGLPQVDYLVVTPGQDLVNATE
jgi:hypothetical protein